ncbi:caspase-6-like [Nelusetta ayraudi]|uniref:caspase-6-like n=1 Tax=Nelusetta ayraudi TaxID=303726 RepID=UPI003F71DBA9
MSETTEDSHRAGTENLTTTDGFSRSAKVLDPAREYKMDYKQRGLALIFNQEKFHWDRPLKQRSGSTADRKNLVQRLTELNFEVKFYDNSKQADVQDILNKAAKEDHSDRDCFLLVFLSHGDDDYVSTYDGQISIKEITTPFKGNNCQSLVGKPKIFIFQACRGNKYEDSVTPASGPDSEPALEVEDGCGVQTLPAGADFIMCYSVAEGYYSFREIVNGSWYIQDLCKLLQQYGNSLEFTELLTLVNRKVSMRSLTACQNVDAFGKKQMPCFASMLTRKLYFRPKE